MRVKESIGAVMEINMRVKLFVRQSIVCMVICLFFAGCHQPAALPPLPRDAIIVAFGDSLTAGTGAEEHESYPAFLSRITGREIINAGIAGETTDTGLARLKTILTDYKPSLMILCEGGNDMLRKRPDIEIAANLRAMIQMIRARNCQVLLIGVPRPSLILKTAGFYSKLSREFDIPYEGTIVAYILSRPASKSDPIHPNATGYRLMAESIAPMIR